jgi:type III restriction enzyme
MSGKTLTQLPGMATAHASDLTLIPTLASGDTGEWLDEYEEFLLTLCTDDNRTERTFQMEAIRSALRFFKPGRYSSVDDLVAETWNSPTHTVLQSYYGTEATHLPRCSFPGLLAATLDLATAAGKSYVMYGILRIALNEGWYRRALVLCPSLTIETGLRNKFAVLQTRHDLTATLPSRPNGIRRPNLLADSNTTIGDADICIENVHATYQATGSSLRTSFGSGSGRDTIVLNDETHHVYNVAKDLNNQKAVGEKGTLWHQFCADPEFAFGAVLGVSGTCYRPDAEFPYFADVIYRYPVRDAIADGIAKEVDYVSDVTGDLTPDKDVLFEALWQAHQTAKAKLTPLGIRPVALAVTALQSGADKLAAQLIRWADTKKQVNIADSTIIVTSKADHAEGRSRLARVDDPAETVEFIVSVSMLTEGWDAKNVFTILPCEEKAFNSKLLIAQVLGRGLRIPNAQTPVDGWKVVVLNHKNWAGEVQALVDEVLDRSSTVAVAPVEGTGVVPHITLDRIEVTTETATTHEQVDAAPISPELLATGTADLHKQDPSKRQHFILSDPLHRRAESKIDVSTGADTTWLEISAAARRVRAALRTEHRSDAAMTAVLKEWLTQEALEDLIRRSLARVGGATHTEISPENLTAVDNFCRTKLFPAQGTLFDERVVVTRHEQVVQLSTRELNDSTRRIGQLAQTHVSVCFSSASRALHAANRPGEEANLAEALTSSKFVPLVLDDDKYRSPTNMVVTSFRPEGRFLRDVLADTDVASRLTGWIKNPDSGFWSIPYEVSSGTHEGDERRFNPDFLCLEPVVRVGGNGHIYVIEIKDDTHDEAVTSDKVIAAEAYVQRLNELLDEDDRDDRPRYSFHLLTPQDYGTFLAWLREGHAHTFIGKVHAALRRTETPPEVAGQESGSSSVA